MTIMANPLEIVCPILLILSTANVWCTTTTMPSYEPISVTTEPTSTIESGRDIKDLSAYINLILCPLELEPWDCARQKSRNILDNWDNDLHGQWNKLKEEADRQLNMASNRRGYTINQYFTKEKPSTILKKIEITIYFMKHYLAESLDGFLGREINHYHGPATRNVSRFRHLKKNNRNNLEEYPENRNDRNKKNNTKGREKYDQFSERKHGIHRKEDNDDHVNDDDSDGDDDDDDDRIGNGSSDDTLNTETSEYGDDSSGLATDDKTDDYGGIDSKHKKIIKYGRSNGETRGKKKKKKKAIIKLMLLGSFLKAKIELLLKIFSAGLQVKFFGIALIGLLINIARFWIDLKRGSAQKVVFVEHAHHQHHYEDHGDDWDSGAGGYWKRSLQIGSSNQSSDLQQQYAQEMAYRNQ